MAQYSRACGGPEKDSVGGAWWELWPLLEGSNPQEGNWGGACKLYSSVSCCFVPLANPVGNKRARESWCKPRGEKGNQLLWRGKWKIRSSSFIRQEAGPELTTSSIQNHLCLWSMFLPSWLIYFRHFPDFPCVRSSGGTHTFSPKGSKLWFSRRNRKYRIKCVFHRKTVPGYTEHILSGVTF